MSTFIIKTPAGSEIEIDPSLVNEMVIVVGGIEYIISITKKQ